MSGVWNQLLQWWSGGDVLMPVMLAVALVLYALVGERLWVLFGPASRRQRRRDELTAILADDHRGDTTLAWRKWLAQYVAVAESAELTRGLAAIRVLALALPLLGLLGTVSGMVETFGALAAGPGAGGSAQRASAGIGLALTATQYGMALAVPAVISEWLLRRRAEDLVLDREACTSGLLAGGGAA